MPEEAFVAAWNAAGSLTEAVERVKQLAGGSVPRWAVMAWAAALRKAGVALKDLRTTAGPDIRGRFTLTAAADRLASPFDVPDSPAVAPQTEKMSAGLIPGAPHRLLPTGRFGL